MPENSSLYDKYRFYQCYQTWKQLNCTQIQSPQESIISISGYDTKLFLLPTYIPKILDPIILKFKSIPDIVKIE
jgi:hypothetical protein